MRKSVVLDCGSWEVKAGLAGDCAPRHGVRTLAGRAMTKFLEAASDSPLFLGEEAEARVSTLELYGDPLSVLQKVTQAALCDRLRVPPESTPLVLTLSDQSLAMESGFIETLFESFETPALLWASAAACGVFSRGGVSGLAADGGELGFSVVPVFEGLALKDLARFSDQGGAATRRAMRESLGLPAAPAVDFQLDHARSAIFANPRATQWPLALPDGRPLQLPRSALEEAEAKIVEELLEDIRSTREALAQTGEVETPQLFLQGGAFLLPGLERRLHAAGETPNFAPKNARFEAWIGASLFASLESTASLLVPKSVYDEFGADAVLHRNFQ